MQIIGGTQNDPSKGPGDIPTGIAARGGIIILHNLSPFELKITFNNDPTRTALLFAWQPRKFDFCGKRTETLHYEILSGVSQNVSQQNTPSSVLWGESYAPGEPVPDSMPNYDRLSNVGNPTLAISSTPAISNNGNPPGYPMVQAQPNDQTSPDVNWNNDGSITWLIKSIGLLLNVLQVIRGTDTVAAQITLGDSQNPGMLVMHGQADSASTAGQANTATVASTSTQFRVYDNGLGTVRDVAGYEGPTDPSTYLTPSIGDIWYQG